MRLTPSSPNGVELIDSFLNAEEEKENTNNTIVSLTISTDHDDNLDLESEPKKRIVEDPKRASFMGGYVEMSFRGIQEEVMKAIMPLIDPTAATESTSSNQENQELQNQDADQQQEHSNDRSGRLNAVEKVDDLEFFYYDEIVRGACLGNGSFGSVYGVQGFKALPQNDEKFTSNGDGDDGHKTRLLEARKYYTKLTAGTLQGQDSNFSKDHIRIEGKNSESSNKKTKMYAIKCLKEKFDDPKVFRFAAKDFETEANLLATLDHPNIISIFAVSASGTKAAEFKSKTPSENSHKDFFLVLDRLSSTLTDKIASWKLEKQRISVSPMFYRAHHFSGIEKRRLLLARLDVAYDIACAIAYLHKNNIVYRDLKAENVGFDAYDGKCKLFDFGLARKVPKEFPEKTHCDPVTSTTTYNMSGRTGSLLLMSPEVFKEEPYNEKADVYSFTVLLWNMLQLELPYREILYDMSVFTDKVMIKGTRPPVSHKWPKKIQQLLHVGWAKGSKDRPSMENVCEILKEESHHNSLCNSPGRPSLPKQASRRSAFM